MTLKYITLGAVLVLLLVGAVLLWPDVEAILTLGAADLLAGGYVSAYTWSQRRRRRGEEASTEPRGTIPFTGWRSGGPGL